MTYSHHSIGTHILPVVFNVHDGRSVLFYLKAQSVAPYVGCLSVRSCVVQLQPVPLGVGAGPMQAVELTNSGSVPATWRIDLGLIAEHNASNYDFEILNVAPTEGVLDAESTTFLHFTFTPLEAKPYNFPIRIEVLKDGRPAEELPFEIRFHGVDPEKGTPDVPKYFPENLPIQIYSTIPGCGAAISIEILDFGNCPLRSLVSRMLVLVNHTTEFVLSYKWLTRGLFRSDSELIVCPSEGELAPGSYTITVFRLFCTEPVDVSGEVQCALEWTHINSYGQSGDAKEDNTSSRPEYISFHSSHVHEPSRIKKGLGSEIQHVSVANRLTVSRFRNLMSTAAGQKFLNENLHRTAVLASHIPSMNHNRSQLGGLGGRGGGGGAGGGSGGMQRSLGDNTSAAGGLLNSQLPQSPTTFPLCVRIRCIIADWGVPPEAKDDFLIVGPSLAAAQEDRGADDWNRTKRAGGAAQADAEQGNNAMAAVIPGVLQHLLQEVMAEEGFGQIIDNMLYEEPPLFAQFEDSPPPGALQASPLRFPQAVGADNDGDTGPSADAAASAAATTPPPPSRGLSGAVLGGDDDFGMGAVGGTTTKADVLTLDDHGNEVVTADVPGGGAAFGHASPLGTSGGPGHADTPWRSDLLLDFNADFGNTPARPLAQVSSTDGVEANSSTTGGSETGKGNGATADAEGGEDAPLKAWEDALQAYGEVDLECFKVAAGEVLDQLLLDMMDDVIAGRLNWQRKLPPPRGRARGTLR
eukprot:TRINITY_DN27809_c0_g3_i1.p1 TRINITY_DN27809_c0_g3~~TRINITY_DN27809_c0_g3_i1.p1  ORF type:complete len:750 (-),score=140.04 TRINITY_DN27809_c0_g3_i1:178-2427(-)